MKEIPMINRILIQITFSILLVIGMTSCISQTPLPEKSFDTTIFIVTQTEVTPHPTQTFTVVEHTSTNTAIPPTHTSTVAPSTQTPFPTLANSEVPQFINNLASTDELCLFPCWGGIVPGITYWYQVQPFLPSISDISRHSPSSPRGFDVNIPLPKQFPHNYLWITFYTDKNESVKYITGWRYNLTIDQVLQKYGKPDQVYLHIIGVLPSDNMEVYDLILSYEKKGFFLQYSGEIKNQPSLKLCPLNIKTPSFWLWDPQDKEAMSTIVNGTSDYRFPGLPDTWQKYKEIEEITKGDMTLDKFFKIYSNDNSVDKCFSVNSPYLGGGNNP
jgi:hypothetical protein